MPIDKYFQGHGAEVMANMKKTYGNRAEEVFYATANKKKSKPKGKKKAKKPMRSTGILASPRMG